MRQRIREQFQNVLVGQSIEHVLSAPATGDQVFAAQDPEALRDDRHRLALCRGQFGHADLAPGQARKHFEPGDIGQRTEEPGGLFEGFFIQRKRRLMTMDSVVWLA